MVEQNNIYMENTEKKVEGKGGVWYGDIVHARTDSHEGRRGTAWRQDRDNAPEFEINYKLNCEIIIPFPAKTLLP